MITPQASVFGFPNPLIGIVGLHRGRWSPACWRWPRSRCRGGIGSAWPIGTLLGAVFVHWLIFQSLYRIGALCPYCMVVWAVTIPLLVVVVVDRAAARCAGNAGGAGRSTHWRWSLVTLWFTAVILLILVRFWNYWSTLI